MKGYMSGASTEPELKTIRAPKISSKIMSGQSHHFFSCFKNRKNSLHSRHMDGVFLSELRAFGKRQSAEEVVVEAGFEPAKA